MRGLFFGCLVVLMGCGSALADDRTDLDGTWIGTHDDRPVVWQLLDGNRLRLDDRPADYEIHGDTLVVRFDPPPQQDGGCTTREKAVYRFVASVPHNGGPARLFVYGFDLGNQGALLQRESVAQMEPPAPEEDAAPHVPAPPTRPTPPQTAAIQGASHRSQH